jgi:hypothetical protein
MREWWVTESIVYKVKARSADEACNVIITAENPDDYYWMCDGRSATEWPEDKEDTAA